MQTGLADRNGMYCRKAITVINDTDKCRNLLSKSKFLHFYDSFQYIFTTFADIKTYKPTENE